MKKRTPQQAEELRVWKEAVVACDERYQDYLAEEKFASNLTMQADKAWDCVRWKRLLYERCSRRAQRLYEKGTWGFGESDES